MSRSFAIGTCTVAALYVAGSAVAQSADPYDLAPLVATCDQWGTDAAHPPLPNGVGLGVRVSKIKEPIKRTKVETRKFDKLVYLSIMYDDWGVDAVRCDAGDPITVGYVSQGEGGPQIRSLEAWKQQQTADLGRITGRKVSYEAKGSFHYLWSVNQAAPVPRSAATNYGVLQRVCMVGKGRDERKCGFIGWSMINIRSLDNTLMNN